MPAGTKLSLLRYENDARGALRPPGGTDMEPKDLSVVNHCDSGFPPFYLIKGKIDRLHPRDNSDTQTTY